MGEGFEMMRPVDRRAFLMRAGAFTAAGIALLAAGCGSDGGDGGDATPAATTAGGGSTTPTVAGIRPVLLTQEFIANRNNRFAVGLLTTDNELIANANVHLRFFTLTADGTQGTLRGEGDAEFVQLNVEEPGAGTTPTTSFYLASVPFDAAGKWGVEISVTPDDGSTPGIVQVPVTVVEQAASPNIGELAPASQNDTFTTNPNTESLCSRSPVCPLHDKVIADILTNGRPKVIQFSTPAFCETRFCGPVLDVLLQRVPEYEDRVDFVHIEVWQDFQLRQYRPAMQEWELSTEPFTFFLNGDGRVVLRLESIFTDEELASALEQLVQI